MISERSLKILIAEDDRGIQTLLLTILTREGFTVDCVGNGLDVLERCAAAVPYDAILLDLAMPHASGADVLRRLADANRADVLSRIIVVTAASAKEAGNLRGLPVIRKPFDIRELIDVIRATTARAAASTLIAVPPPATELSAR